jgi:hypothetical protein
LRLLLIRAGYPRPQTQIPVHNEYGVLIAVLDLGWEHMKIGADYDGEHRWSKRAQIDNDIMRFNQVTELGWIDVRVTSRDTEANVLRRIEAAWERRL